MEPHSPSPLPPPPAPPSPPPALPMPPRHDDTTLTLSLAPPTAASAARPLQVMVPASPRPLPRAKCPSPTGDAPPCTECGRRFLSWKALFGHMRCHPERHWRGITPPGGGGGGGAASSSSTASQFTLKEREVAASLLVLAGAHPARAGAGKGKGKKGLVAPAPAPAPASASAAAPHHSPATCADHRCAVCHRGFASGQALGGHKRCHWPDRSCADQAMLVVATAGSSTTSASPPPAAANATTALDLNLPPPLPRKNLQDGGSNETLDLNLGLQS